MRSDATLQPILHLAHPRPSPWSRLIAPLADQLGVPLVPYPDWLAAVELEETDDVEKMRANPVLRLLKVFRSALSSCNDSQTRQSREVIGIVCMDTSKAQSVAPTLAELRELDAEGAGQWLAAWQGNGFIKQH